MPAFAPTEPRARAYPADPLAAFAAALTDRDGRQGRDIAAIFAHPDDETLALGGHLGGLGRMTLVCLTNGSPADLGDARRQGFATRDAYALARRRELAAALGHAGYPERRLRCLAVPDQEVVSNLHQLLPTVLGILAETEPAFLVTHAYEGGHPDHDAAALLAALVARSLAGCGRPAPAIVEVPLYHLGEGGTVYQRFLPHAGATELAIRLDAAAQLRKGAMLACHATQAETLAPFRTDLERFRLAPAYDFRRLPNGGRLQYEAWQLSPTGADWLRLAGAALDACGVP
jgi:LmbE family N-acetylglucosaminyl deacetylase